MTDKQFANMLLTAGIQENVLVDATIAASKLLKRYGQSVYSAQYSDIIQQASPETAAVLISAKNVGKNDARVLTHIVKVIKESSKNYKPIFVIKSNKKVMEDAEKFVTKQNANATIDKQEAENDQVVINGE